MNKNDILNFLKDQYQKQDETKILLENHIGKDIISEVKEKVRIKMEPGELGLGIDEPLEKFKNQVISDQKPWDTLSRQLNTLYIYNMHKNPDIASKWKNTRETLMKWVESKRKENPDFGK